MTAGKEPACWTLRIEGALLDVAEAEGLAPPGTTGTASSQPFTSCLESLQVCIGPVGCSSLARCSACCIAVPLPASARTSCLASQADFGSMFVPAHKLLLHKLKLSWQPVSWTLHGCACSTIDIRPTCLDREPRLRLSFCVHNKLQIVLCQGEPVLFWHLKRSKSYSWTGLVGTISEGSTGPSSRLDALGNGRHL